MMAAKHKTTISLVLGSGGARGLAHIGVIRWLEENNFKIESISSCSMGALIGGIYAAGKLNDFEHWVRAITKVEIVKLLDLSWNKSGLVKGDKIINTLIDLVGEQGIEDLPITYTAVAADILSEKEVWINSGRLFDAIRASISLPLFFTPFKYNGVDLIDGGVLNPVPIAPTFSDPTDLTIAVNLGGKVVVEEQTKKTKKTKKTDKTDKTEINNSSSFTEKINEYVDRFKESVTVDVTPDWGVYDIANQAFDAMQSTIARQKLAAYPADYVIEIARNACATLEFDRASEMIELGYTKAQESLGSLVTKS
jgi:NTE family protein